MSDCKDAICDSIDNADAATDEHKQDSVLRYTTKQLLSLRDSPLVTKPDDMPPLVGWIARESAATSSMLKSALNGPSFSRTLDQHTVLAPQRTGFPALSGGKESTTLFSSRPTTSSSALSMASRQRQADESRNRDASSSSKTPRGQPYSNEKGSTHHARGFQKGDRKANTLSAHHASSSTHHRRQHEKAPVNDNGNGKNRRHQARDRTSRDDPSDMRDAPEKVPEWMDYNPEGVDDRAEANILEKMRMGQLHDLEAWKSSMKEREAIETGHALPMANTLMNESITTTTASMNVGDTYNMESLHLGNPLTTSMFDTKEATNIDSGPAYSTSAAHRERGSRFAKFFAKQQEQSYPEPPMQGRSITLDDLFQGNTTDCRRPVPERAADVRMFSEQDVLQSIGVSTAIAPPQQPAQSNEDALGFDRVLQLLSQPMLAPPKTSSPTSQPSTPSAVEKKQSYLEQMEPVEHQQPTPKSQEDGESSQRLKQANDDLKKRFGGNLPTSVLRHLSSRATAGGSPSLSSNKSGTHSNPGLHHEGTSPALSHPSPRGATQKPAYNGVSQQTQSPPPARPQELSASKPLTDPPKTAASVIEPHFPYGSPMGVPSHFPATGTLPTLPGGSINHPVAPSPLLLLQHRQQQQQPDQFPQPPMMPPMMPPHMPPGMHMGPPPMLPPFPAHAGRFGPVQPPPVGDRFMPGMPPHLMGNGVPPHLFAKTQGWNQN